MKRKRTGSAARGVVAAGLVAALTVGLTSCAGATGTGLFSATPLGGLFGGEKPTPGAESLGDRLFPELGNGGYDAHSYDVSFDYQPGVMTMASTMTMRAVATQSLSQFSLDSAGQQIESVTVNDQQAQFRLQGEKLVITPANPVYDGTEFTVRVRYIANRSANPLSPAYHFPPNVKWPETSWVNTPDGFALMGQPDRAHVFFPCNDYPSDKATFTFRITTPRGLTGVANGELVAKDNNGDHTTFVYHIQQPIPTDVVQVAVGKFTEIDQTGPDGLPIRSFVPPDQAAALSTALRLTPSEVAWDERTLGIKFPFSTYGLLALNSNYDGVALEDPTLSTFPAKGLEQAEKVESQVEVHELTHQWFGDAVSVADWSDMWLSEGHAVYYASLYSSEHGATPMDQAMKGLYTLDAQQRALSGPPARLDNAADVLFATDLGGALTLYALHNLVGEQTFKKIEQTFFETYQNKSATTQDYIDIANRVSGRNLTGFLDAWLYGSTTPPMPGHPDWTSPKS